MSTVQQAQGDGIDELVCRLDDFYRNELGLRGPIALHEPWLAGNEWAYVKEALDTNWVSSIGPFVGRFERACAELVGSADAVATVNGTSALHLALSVVGVRSGDLVICPAISFVATANAIAYCGAEPLFVDVCAADLTLSAVALEAFLRDECAGAGDELRHIATGRRIGAVIPVHIFGHPAAMTAISAAARAYALPVIEDAAESLGSSYEGRPCGSLAPIAILSFNGNKIATAGGGGAVVVQDGDLAKRVRHLSTTAKVVDGFEIAHDAVGYNYRLPNLNAALACAQFEHIERFVRAKRLLAERYRAMAGALFITEPAHSRSNFWLSAIVLPSAADRDKFLRATNALDIQTRPCWRPLPLLPMYAASPRAARGIDVALDVAARTVNLPSSPQLAAMLLPVGSS